MCVLVNCQTSVKLFSLLIARFMVFLLLSLVGFFFFPCVPDQYLKDVDGLLFQYVNT